jgi:guanine deaminase
MCDNEKYMRRAIDIARQTSLEEKAGGPFGCVIVKDGQIIGEGANRVLAEHDPTSHAEVNAIKSACTKLNSHDLSGCTLYATGEPCPMCYAACCWARVDAIYFASTIHDAKEFGDFDDVPIYEAMRLDIAQRPIKGIELLRDEMLSLWEEFRNLPSKVHY